MSSSAEDLDEIAAAMDEHLAKKPAAPIAQPAPAAAPSVPAVPARPPRPWEVAGRKYPSALDYKGDETAQKINEWLDTVTEKEGAAGKCLVGEALACNLDYYKADVDVHPMIQLAAAGLAFGGVIAFAKFQESQKAKEREAAGEKSPEQKEREAALARLAAARNGGDAEEGGAVSA